ncbi:MAG TPA: PP2C family serine/threonine-protein phosphatase [Longimicrobiales bacterium]|nr:PP2C family serine/threonine-protein phosphatase [Longimicrobiales bacterium]
MHWQGVGLTHRGLRRRRNEDALLVRPETRLYAVADGMGGHAAGDIASRLAVDTLDAAFTRPPSPRIRAAAMAQRLVSAFEIANRAILEHSVADQACSGMGTTLTAVCPLAAVPQCVIAHIGDSRLYRLRERELMQLTGDHTWVQQQVDAGMLTPAQARHHPLSSVLNRVLGTEAVGPADTLVVDVRPGDLLLLCSDGLTTMLEDDDIRGLLDRDVPLDRHARDLVETANLYGGHDNITVIVLAASA